MNNILILGDGLLGTEIRKQTNWDYISRKKDNFNFVEFYTYIKYINNYDTILNCIGFTDTYSNDRQSNWNVNYRGVAGLADYCLKYSKRLIHISTDYVYTYSKENATEDDVPVHCRNWYGYTKLLADAYIQLKLHNYLIIRTSFKPNPFPYHKAITTQKGNFDYVDKIASLIIQLINLKAEGIYNVGTDVKSIYELAVKTKPDVSKSNEILDISMPENITMNINKMRNVI